MVSLDIYRPAAQEQLRSLGEQNNILTLPIIEGQQPTDICRRAISAANLNGADIILFDTAGRTQIDLQMMSEIKQIENTIKPAETFLVADSLTGQVAASVAKEFKNTVNLSGINLPRADGDARGGAALSIKSVVDKPIKFIGTGEKMDALDVFHPSRMADRILGMGDVVSLVERAQQQFDQEEARKIQKKIAKNKFGLDDFMKQIQQIKKMGDMKDLVGMIPGASKMMKESGEEVDNESFKPIEAIINSMTPKERALPSILDQSRKKRISKGSGRSVEEINQLIKQFNQMSKMMKMMQGMGQGKMMQMMQNMKGR